MNENRTSTPFNDEIRILAPWAYALFAGIFVSITVLFVAVVRHDPKAPPFPILCLMGVACGAALGCYAVLIGYINQDAARRNMGRLLWTLLAIFVPNGLGVVLYFVLRKPRLVRCPQCQAAVDPNFAFCPRCSHRLKTVCPHCQRSVDPLDKFCPHCGASLAIAAVAPSALASNAPSS